MVVLSLLAATSWLHNGTPQSWRGREIGWGRDKSQRTYPHDFGVALGTDWRKELFVTALAVHVVLFLYEAHVCQGGLAVGTVELFWVPGTAHGYQKGAPGEAENGILRRAQKLKAHCFRTPNT